VKYTIRIRCQDCYKQDPRGCFHGDEGWVVLKDKYDEVFFNSLEEAAAVGYYFTYDTKWEFTIFPVVNGRIDRDNPIPKESLDWKKVYAYFKEHRREIERKYGLDYPAYKPRNDRGGYDDE